MRIAQRKNGSFFVFDYTNMKNKKTSRFPFKILTLKRMLRSPRYWNRPVRDLHLFLFRYLYVRLLFYGLLIFYLFIYLFTYLFIYLFIYW